MNGFKILTLNKKGNEILANYKRALADDEMQMSMEQLKFVRDCWKIEMTNNSYIARIKILSKLGAIKTFTKQKFDGLINENIEMIHAFFQKEGGIVDEDYIIEAL